MFGIIYICSLDEEILLGGDGGKDSCQGDSGGPLAVWVNIHFQSDNNIVCDFSIPNTRGTNCGESPVGALVAATCRISFF